MTSGLTLFGTGILIWILFASLSAAIFFSRRIRHTLTEQGKPFELHSVIALFSGSEYFRSDTYGALVSWTGCGLIIALLVVRAVHNLSR